MNTPTPTQPARDRWEHSRPAFDALFPDGKNYDASTRVQDAINQLRHRQWVGWQAALDWQAAQQFFPPEGQRATCPEAGNDGDALACPPSGVELPSIPQQPPEQQPDPPKQSAVDDFLAAKENGWPHPDYLQLIKFEGCYVAVVALEDYRALYDKAMQLADRCDAAEARCSQWADIAGEHGAECDRLRARLTAAQARAEEAELMRDVKASRPMQYHIDQETIKALRAQLAAAQAEAGKLREAIEGALTINKTSEIKGQPPYETTPIGWMPSGKRQQIIERLSAALATAAKGDGV